MGKLINMIGKKYGRLTCVKRLENGKNGQPIYLFVCEDGNEIEISGYLARDGITKSCGCLNREKSAERLTTHGHTRNGAMPPEYHAWQNMIARCTNPKNPYYKNYGGRGIVVCRRWRHSFENFLSDMGPRPAGLTLDRKNNNKGYSPGNCHWATPAEQGNNKRNNHFITHNGETKTLATWAKFFNIGASALWERLTVQKLSFEEATSRPIKSHKRKKS